MTYSWDISRSDAMYHTWLLIWLVMLYMTRRMTTNCSQSTSQVLTDYYHNYNYTDLTQSGITSWVTHDVLPLLARYYDCWQNITGDPMMLCQKWQNIMGHPWCFATWHNITGGIPTCYTGKNMQILKWWDESAAMPDTGAVINKLWEWKKKGYVDMDVMDNIQGMVDIDLQTSQSNSKSIMYLMYFVRYREKEEKWQGRRFSLKQLL